MTYGNYEYYRHIQFTQGRARESAHTVAVQFGQAPGIELPLCGSQVLITVNGLQAFKALCKGLTDLLKILYFIYI
eukprot:4569877-Pleurochrysis_carterae.AAC.1